MTTAVFTGDHLARRASSRPNAPIRIADRPSHAGWCLSLDDGPFETTARLVHPTNRGGRALTHMMFLTATALPLLVAVTEVGIESGLMLAENAAALAVRAR